MSARGALNVERGAVRGVLSRIWRQVGSVGEHVGGRIEPRFFCRETSLIHRVQPRGGAGRSRGQSVSARTTKSSINGRTIKVVFEDDDCSARSETFAFREGLRRASLIKEQGGDFQTTVHFNNSDIVLTHLLTGHVYCGMARYPESHPLRLRMIEAMATGAHEGTHVAQQLNRHPLTSIVRRLVIEGPLALAGLVFRRDLEHQYSPDEIEARRVEELVRQAAQVEVTSVGTFPQWRPDDPIPTLGK